MERAPECCLVCGAKEKEPLITIGEWQVMRCPACGMGSLDPRPSVADLAELYDKQYCKERFCEGGGESSLSLEKRLSLESSRLRFIKKFKATGKVLDVGCGFGYFLAACREKGYLVHGVDFSGYAVEHAQNRLKIPVTVGPLDSAQLEGRQFDVVTMWHSLEHTPDPSSALEKARGWLKTDGVLVVDVPNYLGTDAAKYGREWTGWDPPYHLWHFTPETLVRILAKHGFEVQTMKTYHSEYIKEKLKKHLLLKPVARMIAQLYSGHSVAVVARVAAT